MRYRNPVIRGMNADPSVARRGEDYYLATSSFGTIPGLPIYHSRDLVNWRLAGHALPEGIAGQSRVNIFAPTLRYARDRFYLVSTDVRGLGNFVTNAPEPEGPWSPPVAIDEDGFDPSLCFAADGTVYYTRRGRIVDRDIVQAEIDPDTGRLLTPTRPVALGFVSDDAEGPHLYQIGGAWYLCLAEGGSRQLHMQTVARAPGPWGPFEVCPHNPFLAQHHAWWNELLGAGHAELFEAHDGSWWAAFLATRHPSYDALSHIGRETFLAPVIWRDGWPEVPPGALHSLEVAGPTPPRRPWPAPPARDDFDTPGLGGAWVTLGRLTEDEVSLSARPGHLRLGHGPAWDRLEPGGAVPTFVGRRQEDLECTATAALELGQGDQAGEAGLAVYLTAEYHYEIVARRDGAGTEVFLRRSVGDCAVAGEPVRLPGHTAVMRVAADADRYRFEVEESPGSWRAVGTGLTRLVSSELAATWNGVMLGMWSAGDGGGWVADFDWFEYRGYDAPPDSNFDGEEER